MITINEKEFMLISNFVKLNYGINLTKEKKTLIEGRLNLVVDKLGFNNFTDYFNYVISDSDALKIFINKITTNHTFFMRESKHFYYFKEKVLPSLLTKVTDKDLRIWCNACSSGEEPYTLAMILDEYFGHQKLLWDTKILATDVSDEVLKTAIKGIYSNDKIKPLPSKWRNEYFMNYNNTNSVLINKIRNDVIYRRFNLKDEYYPFKQKFHVIFCRNVMIYFDETTKNEIVKKFYNLLHKGGYLFIGHSETINKECANFQYIMPAVYRKD